MYTSSVKDKILGYITAHCWGIKYVCAACDVLPPTHFNGLTMQYVFCLNALLNCERQAVEESKMCDCVDFIVDAIRTWREYVSSPIDSLNLDEIGRWIGDDLYLLDVLIRQNEYINQLKVSKQEKESRGEDVSAEAYNIEYAMRLDVYALAGIVVAARFMEIPGAETREGMFRAYRTVYELINDEYSLNCSEGLVMCNVLYALCHADNLSSNDLLFQRIIASVHDPEVSDFTVSAYIRDELPKIVEGNRYVHSRFRTDYIVLHFCLGMASHNEQGRLYLCSLANDLREWLPELAALYGTVFDESAFAELVIKVLNNRFIRRMNVQFDNSYIRKLLAKL